MDSGAKRGIWRLDPWHCSPEFHQHFGILRPLSRRAKSVKKVSKTLFDIFRLAPIVQPPLGGALNQAHIGSTPESFFEYFPKDPDVLKTLQVVITMAIVLRYRDSNSLPQ